jgi:hypothetical protein
MAPGVTVLETQRERAAEAAPSGFAPAAGEWPSEADSIGSEERVDSFRLARLSILGWRARLAGVVFAAVVSQRRARIAVEQAVRLGAQELRPAGADPPRGGPEAGAAQHGRDRRGRDADAELQQLTLNAHIAPAWILPRQSLDQAARLGRKRRTTWPRTTWPVTVASSTSLKQCPVPAAKRLRADRKAAPARGWEHPAGRSEQGSVDRRVLRTPSTAPEDRRLVAQDDDLKLPLTAAAGEYPNDPAEKPVEQTHQHHAQSEPLRRRSRLTAVPVESNFFTPQVHPPRFTGPISSRTPGPPSPSTCPSHVGQLRRHDMPCMRGIT